MKVSCKVMTIENKWHWGAPRGCRGVRGHQRDWGAVRGCRCRYLGASMGTGSIRLIIGGVGGIRWLLGV